jgi:hypothetical protein
VKASIPSLEHVSAQLRTRSQQACAANQAV